MQYTAMPTRASRTETFGRDAVSRPVGGIHLWAIAQFFVSDCDQYVACFVKKFRRDKGGDAFLPERYCHGIAVATDAAIGERGADSLDAASQRAKSEHGICLLSENFFGLRQMIGRTAEARGDTRHNRRL